MPTRSPIHSLSLFSPMEFRDPISHHRQLYQSAPSSHINSHQNYQPPLLHPHPSSSSSSFSYFPNPNSSANPNSFHAFENPIPYAPAAEVLGPPVADPYPNANANLYGSHLPSGGPHPIAAHSYHQAALDYYYQQHYAAASSAFVAAKVGSGNTNADLEIKKLRVLQCGAPADSVRICSICNVVCNSDKVFASHLGGEKHKLKALGIPFNRIKPKVPAHTKALHFIKKAKHPAPGTTTKKTTSKALVASVRSSFCDVCKIDCKSQEVLNIHKLGKKHIRNLQKLCESIKPKPANAPPENSTSESNPCSSGSKAANEQTKQNAAPATKEELEAKKQKVLNGGATADAVRVCTQCNVVCNSQEVYNSHIVGKRHLAITNKQQQAAPVS